MKKTSCYILFSALCSLFGVAFMVLQSSRIQNELSEISQDIINQKNRIERLISSNADPMNALPITYHRWSVVARNDEEGLKSNIAKDNEFPIYYKYPVESKQNEILILKLLLIDSNKNPAFHSTTEFNYDPKGKFSLLLPNGGNYTSINLRPITSGSLLHYLVCILLAVSCHFFLMFYSENSWVKNSLLKFLGSAFISFLFLIMYRFLVIHNLGNFSFNLLDLNFLILIYPLFFGLINQLRLKIVYKIFRSYGIFIYSFLISSAFGCILLLNEKIIHSGIAKINIDEILLNDLRGFVYIFLFICYSYLHFALSRKLFPLLDNEMGFTSRFIFITLGATLSLVFLNFLSLDIYGFPWLIFFIVFNLFMDIYRGRYHFNITYIIWWMLIYAGFISIALFSEVSTKEYKDRQRRVTEIYHPYSSNSLENVYKLASDLILEGFTLELSNLQNSGNAGIDVLKIKFNKGLQRLTDNKPIEVKNFGCYDVKKIDIFQKEYRLYEHWIEAIQASVKKSENIYYNPISRLYYIWFKIENEYFFGNQIELFLEISDIDISAQDRFIPDDILVFKNNNLVYGNEELLFGLTNFPVGMLKDNQIIDQASFVVDIPDPDYTIVSVKPLNTIVKPISVFSTIFILSGILALFLLVINTIKANYFKEGNKGNKTSLRWKIQVSVILLILFTFGAIAFTTIYFFNSTINKKEIVKLSKHLHHLSEGIRDNGNLPLSIKNEALRYIAHYNTASQLSFAIYDADLQAWIYDDSKMKSKTTFRNQLYSIEVPNLRDEEIIYRHDLSAFFTRFYQPAQYDLILFSRCENCTQNKLTIISYLSTLLNVYVFLFLLSGAISLFIANSITKPLSKLAERFKEFKLGKNNTRLEWDTNDEIGMLIKDYNELTHKLAESASVIARTERDTAWREMARQVAHEIKNPLTPMKLSIQYLQKAVANSPEKAHQLIEKVSSTLIEQIDNLSQIAGEFSNFATLPKASNERIILNEVVEHIHDLFRKRDDMDINMVEPMEDIYVFADKNHLVRVLNNIVKNATQAIPADRRGVIDIELSKNDDFAIVSVRDNGVGIPDSMKDKVFTPNFTTKSSGTGLGLAISANMMDAMNGRIYFKSKEGEGTTFYIELPLLGYEQNNEESVFLDDESI